MVENVPSADRAVFVIECAICGDFTEPNRVHRDHCHKTGLWRDPLCFRCNLGLGYFRDKPHALRRAAEYVERHLAAHQAELQRRRRQPTNTRLQAALRFNPSIARKRLKSCSELIDE